MNRKVTQEQNDTSLIFGNLPKRLQMKIAANCNSAAEDELEETVAGNEIPTNGQLGYLSAKNCEDRSHVTNQPVLEASGSTFKSKAEKSTSAPSCEYVIPGILRVNATDAVKIKKGRQQPTNNKKQNCTATRIRGKTYPSRVLESAIHDRSTLLPTSPVRVRLTTEHPNWFEQLLDMPDVKGVVKLYDQLMVLQDRNLLLVNWNIFCEIHEKLQYAFKKIILNHLKFACEQKVDTFFWKLLLYNIREYLKAQKTENAIQRIPPLIDQSQNFYASLFHDLKDKFFFSTKYENIAKVVGQRLLICMGDLSRYRAFHSNSNDFSDTFKYYHKAQALIPSNGAPYNQLAIVAVHARKKFDAVYYYMRSLLTTNAIKSAKESLLDLFDDIRKKYEETELKRSPLHNTSVKHRNAASMRKEVWIYPDGVRRLHRTDIKNNNKNKATVAEQERFDDMPSDELLRRIINLYLYLIGKFYMGIGVENVYQHLRKLLIELSVALNHHNLLTRSKVLKMVSLNIFVIEHNKLNESRREVRYHAFNFSNGIFGLMLRKANQILVTPKPAGNVEGLEDEFVELNTTLQFIRIYVQWLSINVDVWEPIRNEDHSFIDCWHELQQLFRNIARIFEKHEDEFNIKLRHVILDEDVFLSGFLPLGRENISTSITPPQESLQFLKRLKKIEDFQQCFEEYQDCLRMSLSSSFVLEELNTDMQAVLSDLGDKKSDDVDSPIVESIADNNENVAPCISNVLNISPTSPCASLTQLSKLKRQLEEKTKAKQLCNAKLEEILKFVDTKLYIEVRPRYLLPDTNCFIDCLEDFERLARDFTRYTLIIPLTVVKELDGLSKGVKLNLSKYAMQKQRIHHFDEVSSLAKKTLEFIRKTKNNVKCATTKGSIINASLFGLVEEEYASNDDKILATAVSLFKNLSTETCRDGKCLIQTELVLITTDRNLRVKALSRNLAVSALDEFLQWAKNSNES